MTSALAELFSGCKVAFGILLVCLHCQWMVWSSSDWQGWSESEGLSARMYPCISSDGVLHENEMPSVLSSRVLPVQSLASVSHLHPSESLAPYVPSDTGYVPVNLHCGHDLAGNT